MRVRTFVPLLLLAGFLFIAGVGRAAGGEVEGVERPHIVLFISDDHTWHDCGPYGASDIHTPALDRLAAESMRFDAAFAASPTCSPSRSAIYTGLYPFRNGAHANHSLVDENLRTLPHYMKDAGYRVVLAGKTHIGPRERFPFEYLPDSNVMPPGRDHVLYTDLNTAAVDDLLAEHDRDRPLCLIVCSHSPHVYWPENEEYDPAALDLPPYLLDTPETRDARGRYYTDVTLTDRRVGEVMDSLEEHGYADDTLFMYTSDQGAQWPFGKWNLYDAGIRVPLLVRWPGEVEADSTTDAMVTLIDLLPTMIEAAGGEVPADLDGRGFLPVLRGESEHHREAVHATHTGDGRMNRSPMRCIRTPRYKLIVNLAPDTLYQTHITHGIDKDGRDYWDSWVRAAEDGDEEAARLIRRYRHRPPVELYDLTADPWERHNLADDPAHAATLDDLQEKLDRWRVQQGEDLDEVPMPEDARRGELPYAR